MRQEKAAAKKPLSKWTIAGITVLLAVLVTILILAVVPTSASVRLSSGQVSSVQVIPTGKYAWEGGREDTTVELIGGIDDEKIENFFEGYKSATTFSVGYGLMNNLWSFKPFKSDMEPKDVTAIKAFSPVSSQEMYVISYAESKTATVAKDEITYDRAYVFVPASDKSLITYSVYFVDSGKVIANDRTYTVQEYRGYIQGGQFQDAVDALK